MFCEMSFELCCCCCFCSCCCCYVLQLISSFASSTAHDMRAAFVVYIWLRCPLLFHSLCIVSANMTCFWFDVISASASTILFLLSPPPPSSLSLFYHSLTPFQSRPYGPCKIFVIAARRSLLLKKIERFVLACLLLFIFHRRAPVIGSVVHE